MNKKKSIKTRIFFLVVSFIVLICASIIFTFNIFINNYIKSTALSQLEAFTKMSERPPQDNKGSSPEFPDPLKQPRNRIGVQANFFIISSDYSLKDINQVPRQKEESTEIANVMKKRNISLMPEDEIFIRTSIGEYYITIKEDIWEDNGAIVFFISITEIKNFAQIVNTFLILIMIVAIFFSFGIASSVAAKVSKPVKELAGFASKIGEADFSEKDFDFGDEEFIYLASSMNEMASKLYEYDKDQKTFFQNVSHELRTPLMSIKCYAEGIEYGVMDPVKSSGVIIKETDRLSDMIEDILYISRVDNITNHFENEEYDIRETLSNAAEVQRVIANKNNINFEFKFDEEEIVFKYDEKYMQRAFTNLISNAIRYAKSKITLVCTKKDDSIIISIIDDGAGISEEDMPYIFDRFYKGSDGKNGIGLSIVKSIVEMYNGNIFVSSNGGTNFTIEFKNTK